MQTQVKLSESKTSAGHGQYNPFPELITAFQKKPDKLALLETMCEEKDPAKRQHMLWAAIVPSTELGKIFWKSSSIVSVCDLASGSLKKIINRIEQEIRIHSVLVDKQLKDHIISKCNFSWLRTIGTSVSVLDNLFLQEPDIAFAYHEWAQAIKDKNGDYPSAIPVHTILMATVQKFGDEKSAKTYRQLWNPSCYYAEIHALHLRNSLDSTHIDEFQKIWESPETIRLCHKLYAGLVLGKQSHKLDPLIKKLQQEKRSTLKRLEYCVLILALNKTLNGKSEKEKHAQQQQINGYIKNLLDRKRQLVIPYCILRDLKDQVPGFAKQLEDHEKELFTPTELIAELYSTAVKKFNSEEKVELKTESKTTPEKEPQRNKQYIDTLVLCDQGLQKASELKNDLNNKDHFYALKLCSQYLFTVNELKDPAPTQEQTALCTRIRDTYKAKGTPVTLKMFIDQFEVIASPNSLELVTLLLAEKFYQDIEHNYQQREDSPIEQYCKSRLIKTQACLEDLPLFHSDLAQAFEQLYTQLSHNTNRRQEAVAPLPAETKSLASSSPRETVKKAIQQFNDGKLCEAAELFEEALRTARHENDDETLYVQSNSYLHLGLIYLYLNQADKAEQYFKAGIHTYGKDNTTRLSHGFCAVQLIKLIKSPMKPEDKQQLDTVISDLNTACQEPGIFPPLSTSLYLIKIHLPENTTFTVSPDIFTEIKQTKDIEPIFYRICLIDWMLTITKVSITQYPHAAQEFMLEMILEHPIARIRQEALAHALISNSKKPAFFAVFTGNSAMREKIMAELEKQIVAHGFLLTNETKKELFSDKKNLPADLFKLGLRNFKKGSFEMAKEGFLLAAAASPTSEKTQLSYIYLGLIEVYANQPSMAAHYFTQAARFKTPHTDFCRVRLQHLSPVATPTETKSPSLALASGEFKTVSLHSPTPPQEDHHPLVNCCLQIITGKPSDHWTYLVNELGKLKDLNALPFYLRNEFISVIINIRLITLEGSVSSLLKENLLKMIVEHPNRKIRQTALFKGLINDNFLGQIFWIARNEQDPAAYCRGSLNKIFTHLKKEAEGEVALDLDFFEGKSDSDTQLTKTALHYLRLHAFDFSIALCNRIPQAALWTCSNYAGSIQGGHALEKGIALFRQAKYKEAIKELSTVPSVFYDNNEQFAAAVLKTTPSQTPQQHGTAIIYYILLVLEKQKSTGQVQEQKGNAPIDTAEITFSSIIRNIPKDNRSATQLAILIICDETSAEKHNEYARLFAKQFSLKDVHSLLRDTLLSKISATTFKELLQAEGQKEEPYLCEYPFYALPSLPGNHDLKTTKKSIIDGIKEIKDDAQRVNALCLALTPQSVTGSILWIPQNPDDPCSLDRGKLAEIVQLLKTELLNPENAKKISEPVKQALRKDEELMQAIRNGNFDLILTSIRTEATPDRFASTCVAIPASVFGGPRIQAREMTQISSTPSEGTEKYATYGHN